MKLALSVLTVLSLMGGSTFAQFAEKGEPAPKKETSAPRAEAPARSEERSAPAPRAETPRAQAPRQQQAPARTVERSAPAPRAETPRAETPRAQAPAPRVETPRTETRSQTPARTAPAPVQERQPTPVSRPTESAPKQTNNNNNNVEKSRPTQPVNTTPAKAEPKKEEPKKDQPKTNEQANKQPSQPVNNTPAKTEPKKEEPKKEDPKKDESKKDDSKQSKTNEQANKQPTTPAKKQPAAPVGQPVKSKDGKGQTQSYSDGTKEVQRENPKTGKLETTAKVNTTTHQSTFLAKDGTKTQRSGTTTVKTLAKPDAQGRLQVKTERVGKAVTKTTVYTDHKQIVTGGTTKNVYKDHTDIVRGNMNVRETKVSVKEYNNVHVTNNVMLRSNTRVNITVNNYVTRTVVVNNYDYGYRGGWVHNYAYINYRPIGWSIGWSYPVYVPVWDPMFHPYWYNSYYAPANYGWYTEGGWRFQTHLTWNNYNYCWYGCSSWIGPVYHWDGYYAYYYHPYSHYRGPAFWLTDFFVSDVLETAYEARKTAEAEAAAEQAQEAADEAARLQDLTDDELAQAQQDLADAKALADQQAQANAAVVNTQNTAIDESTQQALTVQTQQVTDSLQNQTSVQLADLVSNGQLQNYKFVVHDDINAATLGADGQADGLSCSLSEGDIIQLASGATPADGDTTATMTVVTSKQGDCLPNVSVTVSMESMQGMLNDFTTRVEQGMKVMKDKNIGSTN